MKSQIPTAAAKYFESVGVDIDKHHPVVSAVFSPGRGWRPTFPQVKVSHTYLVQLRDHNGVTDVCLKAPNPGGFDNLPDFTLKHLIGDMSPLDAEFTDGVPVSEGSGVVTNRDRMIEILTALGISFTQACYYMNDVDGKGQTEFIVREIDNYSGYPVEGWRYHLATRRKLDLVVYELSVLAHDERREA